MPGLCSHQAAAQNPEPGGPLRDSQSLWTCRCIPEGNIAIQSSAFFVTCSFLICLLTGPSCFDVCRSAESLLVLVFGLEPPFSPASSISTLDGQSSGVFSKAVTTVVPAQWTKPCWRCKSTSPRSLWARQTREVLRMTFNGNNLASVHLRFSSSGRILPHFFPISWPCPYAVALDAPTSS